MDTTQLLEAWGTLGATGVLSLLFGFMITNLIKSQSAQNESLDKIAVDVARSEGTSANVESILLKLLDCILLIFVLTTCPFCSLSTIAFLSSFIEASNLPT